MARHVDEEAEWDEEEWRRDEDDNERDEEDEPTIPCPYCRREIHEDSPQCPHCGQYIVEEDSPATRKPWLIIIGVLLCLLVIWLWIVQES
jgi:hypothetical protein